MEEDKKLIKLMGDTKKDIKLNKLALVFSGIIEKAIARVIGEKIEAKVDVNFPDTQKVEITNPQETQKVEGEVTVKFPSIQKIFGEVIAKVTFPLIQKVEGTVKAIIDFPKVQKVEGEVKVDFPETQKIKGEVKTDIPRVKTEKLDVVPVAFFDGKRLLSPEVFTQSLSGDGKTYAAIKELTNKVATQSVFYTGQVKITVSGNAKQLGSSKDIKTLVVQALKDNRDTIYISSEGNLDYELQPGQPLTIVIDNLNKVYVVGSYSNDGVCYAAS